MTSTAEDRNPDWYWNLKANPDVTIEVGDDRWGGMSRRVQFDHYGPVEVLRIAEVLRPVVEAGQVLVQVRIAGINPGEIAIREGAMEALFPATFPSGQGSDFAGRVVEVGPAVTGFAPGDAVLGYYRQIPGPAGARGSVGRHLQ